MALTVDTLLAAMRAARALHLHCRRIVFTSTTLKDSIELAPRCGFLGAQLTRTF